MQLNLSRALKGSGTLAVRCGAEVEVSDAVRRVDAHSKYGFSHLFVRHVFDYHRHG